MGCVRVRILCPAVPLAHSARFAGVFGGAFSMPAILLNLEGFGFLGHQEMLPW